MVAPVLARLRQAFRARGATAFIVAALLVGVIVGIAAAVLVWAIAVVTGAADWVESAVPTGRAALLLIIPLGLVVSWAIARRFGPGVEGGGVTATMMGLSLHAGYLPTRTVFSKIAATAATLGSGASAGREGPIVQIGGTIGSSFARYTRFGEDQIRSLVAAGAGAGIGASFNAPIAGMLFAMEVILGNFAVRHIQAVVVASVAAAVTTRSLVGQERILSAPVHGFREPLELVLYAILGLIAVVLAIAFLRAYRITHRVGLRLPDWLRPVVAGVAIALVGIAEPRALGTGQEFVGELLRTGPASDLVAPALFVLSLAKIATTAMTQSGGGSGGSFMPSLFVGASAGTGLALLAGPVWGFSTLNPGAFAVVGMAATFAAVARAPLTAVIIVFEITGDYGLVLPLMLAAALATFITERFTATNVYNQPLRQLGINLPVTEDIDLLDTVTVGQVMSTAPDLLDPGMSIAEAEQVMHRYHHHGMAVATDGRLAGLLTRTDLALAAGTTGERGTVADVMNRNPITVTPSMPVSAALARMAALDVGRMPVVSDDDPSRLVGMFRRASVVHAYHQALGATTDRHLYRQRLKQRTEPGTGFFEIPVPLGSAATGLSVRELDWPENAILVSIRRGTSVLIPHGDTAILPNDVITAFGTGEARVALAFLLEPSGDGEQW